ncbi:Transmembrane amino acid transporter family protein [Striga hermonthica]|uniref:Transmembrane amino acid transporter family protein n=1 Tax=Striga hermonthica TaxID=68872 RepID=A0A9N7RGZ7_STRHE|nr:Transmembrane amino acid transporter family protein [Striga hermonthica]
MKQLEEEFGPDRAIEIETDDEENEAERVCVDSGDETESDVTGRPAQHSPDGQDYSSSTFWPQSYRRSMDMYMYTSMTPPTFGSEISACFHTFHVFGGVVTLALVVLCLLWVGVASDLGFHPSGRALNFSNIPITIGIYSFCYGSHSVFPNIYSSMKEPSRFPSVLVISFVIAGLLYAGIAVCGYLMFGEATNPQFTLNLPTNFIASNIAGWAVVVAPVTKFALSITPVALSIEELLPEAYLRSHGTSIMIRTGLVVSTLIVALTVPYFGSVMALIGSFLVMLVSVVLPCACYMRIDRERLNRLEIATCSVIIVVGIVCAVVGTCSAIKSMSG